MDQQITKYPIYFRFANKLKLIVFMILSFFLIPSSVEAVPLGKIDPVGRFTVDTATKTVSSYSDSLENLFSMIIGFLTITAGLYFAVFFIVGGLTWITAGGDQKKHEDARSKLTNGAIGLIIVVAAYSIIFIVGQILGINVLNFSVLIQNVIKFN